MRRLLAAALVSSVATCAALGAAWAATIRGTAGPDRLVGTPRADALYGQGGNDRLDGRGGADYLDGGPGADRLSGGPGDDRIAAQADAGADGVVCGAGRDLVNAETTDTVGADCEVVAVQVSRDLTRALDAQHETQVEPDSFASGRTVVTAFQSGRFGDGGAAAIGWATSRDAGLTWRSGVLPGLTEDTSPPGPLAAVSDPAVAYDAIHGVWLIATLGVDVSTQLLVSRSRDGLTWGAPILASQPGGEDEDHDKEWIVCDNWRSSPFRGRCYLSYLDDESGELRTRRTTDGGLTWSAPVGATGRTRMSIANGVQPVVRPDGTLVMPFAAFAAFDFFADPEQNQIAAIRSTDGGVTFGARVRISEFDQEFVRDVRAPPLPSADVDGAGRIFVAWSDCSYRDECLANDIVVSSSRDGVTWSRPTPLPLPARDSEVHYFVPGLSVDPATSGARARIAVVYYSLQQDCAACAMGVGLITSTNGGRTWSRAQRLDARSMQPGWLAQTGIGAMVGDYISASWAGGRPVPVFALASAPEGGLLRESIFAARIAG